MFIMNPYFQVDLLPSCHYESVIGINNRFLAVVENRARYALPSAQIYFEYNSMEYTFELCSNYEFYQEHNVPDEKDYDLLLSHIKHRFLGIGAYNPDVKVRIKPVGKRVVPSILR
jgi:cytochrome b subunit of formate dehydrogenase